MTASSAKRIKHFDNPNAAFLYVPADQVTAWPWPSEGAIPYDVQSTAPGATHYKHST
jgi:hypothetical protein